jgi:hypothetical protein
MMRIDRELGKEGFQRINFLETKSDLPIIVEVLHRVIVLVNSISLWNTSI